jgi:hypothetical protein
MKGVGAALGDQRDLTSGGATLVGIVACGRDAKLLDGIESGANGAFEGGAANLVVVVDTIESDVGLIAAATIQGAVARINVVVDLVSDKGDAWLQAEDPAASRPSKGSAKIWRESKVLPRVASVVFTGAAPPSITVTVSDTAPSSILIFSVCVVDTSASILGLTDDLKPGAST